ncbi:MAG TPA: amino acid deaminase [Acidobacteriaceae bacterium]
MMSKPENAGPMEKGLRLLPGSIEDLDYSALDWNLLREDLSLPCAVLYQEKLEHNLEWMQRFAAQYGVKLAPHGKTTMAPKLFAMQLQAGAWGITLATAQQTDAAYRHGVRRVLMANQLVGQQNMEIISALLRDPGFEYYCLVDSADQVELLGSFYASRGQRLQVLVELGVEGGRTGVRNDEQLREVLAALARWSGTLALCGVEIYEGVLDDEERIRGLLHRATELTRTLAAEKKFARDPILLSGSGSAWYDVVAEAFAGAALGKAVEIVLRPGCYLTHDAGMYREAQAKILKRCPIAARMQWALLPALQVWAYVQSIPEPEKAIVGLGKRDASFDSGLPIPALHFRPGSTAPATVPPRWAVTRMMDQHAFLRIEPGDDLQVGDMIAFDISHPCLTFDKWRVMPVIDSRYRVVDVIRTFF